jgi:topoisomerase-4 subunit A
MMPLVRLAQDFAQRYPLVEGQGNFGNIDGDSAAAYALHRSTPDRGGDGCCWRASTRTPSISETYNGEDKEPVVLPGAFPNLLANGATGIAVGMATSFRRTMPPKLCDAALHLIKQAQRRHGQADAIRAGA